MDIDFVLQIWLFHQRERLQSQLEERSDLPGHSSVLETRPGGSEQSQYQEQQTEPGGGISHCRERAEDSSTPGTRRSVVRCRICNCHLETKIQKLTQSMLSDLAF